MKILKNFVVFEGLDGSGTTTQLNMLERLFLENRDSTPILYKTFEPTNSSIGRLIRSNLKGDIVLDGRTLAMLFAADRNEHIYGPEGIVERCERGELVVSDRYLLSSLVYQGITCGEELPAMLNRDFPRPELLIFFDIKSETAEKRMAGREYKEIFETITFQTEAGRRYRKLLPEFILEGVRVETIDASNPPDEVAREVWKTIEKMPIFNM